MLLQVFGELYPSYMNAKYLKQSHSNQLSDLIERFILVLHDRPQSVLIVAGSFLGMSLLFVGLCIHSVNQQLEFMSDRLQTHRWALPSPVYAVGPELQRGLPVNQQWLVRHLERLNYQRVSEGILKNAQYSIGQDEISFRNRSGNAQAPASLVSVQFKGDRIVRLQNPETGKEISSYHLEPEEISHLFGSKWEKRTLVRLRDLPPHLPQAVLAIEDRRFFSHHGVDVFGILRAGWKNLRGSGRLQGASTITQQLIKNFYLTRERSLRRKVQEAAMAILLERRLEKKEILELYLNEIYLGQQGPVSIHGVEEASRLYFGKDVRLLSVPEAALLAGMIQAPQKYNPYLHPERAKARRDEVLLAMNKVGSITPQQMADYANAPVSVHSIDPEVNKAPYFVDYIGRQLLQTYSAEELHRANFHIYTTLDLEMQEAAEAALAKGLASIDRFRYRKTGKHAQGCLIAIEPASGSVRAFVGGREYSKSQYDRITQAFRQPGSTFKPIVYAAALQSPIQSQDRFFTPATLLSDQPWMIQETGSIWAPHNYDGSYHGIVTTRAALAQSMNIATVRLSQEVGLNRIASLSRTLGFENIKPYPSLALGAFEASPWQLAQAYTAFANGGKRARLMTVSEITDADGVTLHQNQIRRTPAISPQVAYLLVDMMKTVVTSGTAASVRRSGFSRPVAGKTGTTDDFRDAWFVGFTPDLMCLVWTGYDDNTPLRMNAAQAAVPIWTDFMKKATLTMPVRDFQRPSGIVSRLIDPYTGKLASDSCPDVVQELFLEGTEPLQRCSDYYHNMPQDALTGPQYRGNNTYQAAIQRQMDSNEEYAPSEYSETEYADESELKEQVKEPAQQFIYFAAPSKSHESNDDDAN